MFNVPYPVRLQTDLRERESRALPSPSLLLPGGKSGVIVAIGDDRMKVAPRSNNDASGKRQTASEL